MSRTNALKQECAKNLLHKPAQQQGRAGVTHQGEYNRTVVSDSRVTVIWRTAVIHNRARGLSAVRSSGQ